MRAGNGIVWAVVCAGMCLLAACGEAQAGDTTEATGTSSSTSSSGGSTSSSSGSTSSSSGGGSTSGSTYQYLIYGVVLGHATVDCPEGSGTFDDYKGYATEVVQGEWSATYSAHADAMKTQLRAEYPGQTTYAVESSHVAAGRTAKHAAIIEWTKTIAAWDCRPLLASIGYGTTAQEALDRAVAKKNENGGANATHRVLQQLSW